MRQITKRSKREQDEESKEKIMSGRQAEKQKTDHNHSNAEGGKEFDTVLRNVNLVRPHSVGSQLCDIGIKNGKVKVISKSIDVAKADHAIEGNGLTALPGLVDAHQHVGIYHELSKDAITESKASAQGGVTTGLTYFRTGQYYLNKGGPYKDFFPEVKKLSEGNYYVDYCYHLAPLSKQHIGELERLATVDGVTSFKIFMFYGGHGLHGRSDKQHEFLMIPEDERYDVAHFEFIMRELSRICKENPKLGRDISLSLHCEFADILAAYTKKVEEENKYQGLEAYHHSRPPHSEALAVTVAGTLADETNCPNINLLHLTSRKAVEAALRMRNTFKHINFKLETTVGHLLLDIHAECGLLAKVNPPIRPREDVEYIWDHVLNGDIDWIVSDHACCSHEKKLDPKNPQKVSGAKSGFGGTEYLLSGVFTEGERRGLSLNRIAELLSYNPAKRYALHGKGDVAPGYDADIVLFDPSEEFVVRAADSFSAQGYTPFEGMTLKGKVMKTILRGKVIFEDDKIVGEPCGQFLHRPYF